MRRGFNCIELIVVVLVIAVLVVLLLPTVSKVRHKAAVLVCNNRLRELGIGLNHHRDTFGHFPPGTVPGTVPSAALPPDRRLSWCVALLPFIEKQAAFDRFDPAAGCDAPANATAAKALPPAAFTCPGYPGPWPDLPVTNYVGVAGVGADAAALPFGAPGVGFFGYDRQLKLEHIKDGTAQTIAVTETRWDVGSAVRGGPSTVRGLDLSDEPLIGEGRLFGGLHRRDRFFGTAPLGVQSLMADGSVRLSAVRVDPFVLGALATIAGGEDIPANW